MFAKNRRVISCDPLYQFTKDQIRARIDATFATVIGQTHDNKDQFVWNVITSIEELGRVRLAAMNTFLGDYEDGQAQGRYVPAELPALPFPAQRSGWRMSPRKFGPGQKSAGRTAALSILILPFPPTGCLRCRLEALHTPDPGPGQN